MQKSPVLSSGKAATVSKNSPKEYIQVIDRLFDWFNEKFGYAPNEVGLAAAGKMMNEVISHVREKGLRISGQRQPDKHVYIGSTANVDKENNDMVIENSSHVSEVEWTDVAGIGHLTVTFTDGSQYSYRNVPYTAYRAIILLDLDTDEDGHGLGGQFFSDCIRDNYAFSKINGPRKAIANGVSKPEDNLIDVVWRGLYGVFAKVDGDDPDDYEEAVELAIQEMAEFAEQRIKTLDKEDVEDWHVNNWGLALPDSPGALEFKEMIIESEAQDGEEDGTIFYPPCKANTIYVGLPQD